MMIDYNSHDYGNFLNILFSIEGKFQKFDHGQKKNLELYGSPKPPEYNLSNINTKIHLLYGSNDWLVLKKVILS